METDDSDSIHIQELELFGRVGVTENERNRPQRLTVSMTIWPKAKFEEMQDDITCTVDYSALCSAAREFVDGRSDLLIETLAAALASHILGAFPVQRIQVELRKFVLPDAQYAAVTVVRRRD
jgi:dihydroneopterin aldolase